MNGSLAGTFRTDGTAKEWIDRYVEAFTEYLHTGSETAVLKAREAILESSNSRSGLDELIRLLRSQAFQPANSSLKAEESYSDRALRFLFQTLAISDDVGTITHTFQKAVGKSHERNARRFGFLSDATALLIAPRDHAALEAISRLAVHDFADWCFIHVVEEDGSIRRLRAACRVKEQLVSPGIQLLESRIVPNFCFLNTNPAPLWIDHVGDDWLSQFAADSPELELMKSLGFRSMIFVPFNSGGRCFGSITLFHSSTERAFEPADFEMASSLAGRCAIAIQDARRQLQALAARDKAEQESVAKNRFLAVLSHELRNSLTPVLGWTRIFKNHTAIVRDSILSEGADSLERNTLTMARLLDDCLDLTRIARGKMRVKFETTDFNKIIRSAMDGVRESAWTKGLAFLADVSSVPLWVSGDPTRLHQVVMNLLVNAIKYTPSGGRISVYSAQLEGEVDFQVADTGFGVHSADLERIFEPFEQGGHNPWVSVESGLGLGLAVSRQIIALHDGRIWVESEGIGQGSVFRVRLPLLGSVPTPGPTRAENRRSVRPLQILIVDDSVDILAVMKLQIASLGHTVSIASDVESAMNQIRKHRPDLIISDIKMPGVDGYEFIQNVRSTPETATIPTIAIAGFGMRSEIQKAIEAGFNACLLKPIETEELEQWIDKMINTPGSAIWPSTTRVRS